MSEYYDRQGNPLTLLEWDAMLERCDREYKVVAQDTINGRWFVSTVWMGYDHQYGDGPPLIFETMVFDSSSDSPDLEHDMARYSTEAEAFAGHAAMVEKVTLWPSTRAEHLRALTAGIADAEYTIEPLLPTGNDDEIPS